MSDTPKQPETADRLAKVMARAGLCSRRDAEGWITAGRVTVNGKKVLTPAFNVTSRDRIEVDGAPLAARQGTRVWLYHKPPGLVVTEKDPEGRPTIFEALAAQGLPRVVTVGRLDINTEGLLLLTNDGGLKRVLELPSTGWLRRYRVRAFGSVTQDRLDALKSGIEVEGVKYGPIEATLEREQGANVWLVLGLREGKNREVRNVLGALGLEVNRLIRVSYGPFQLGDIPVGGIEVVRARMLRDQLGKKLSEAAGVDFDSDMPEMAPRPPVRSPRDRDDGRPRPPRGDRPASRFDARDPAARRSGRFDDAPPPRPRRIHFDEEGRAPEAYEPRGSSRPGRDAPPARPFGPRPGRPEGRKPFGERPPGRDAGKPARSERPFEDRPPRRGGKPGAKPFAGKRNAGKPFADKPRGPRPAGKTGGPPKRPPGPRKTPG